MPAQGQTTCRSCGAAHLRSVLDLGRLPLANSNLSEADLSRRHEEPREPLELFFCESCSLVQIGESVSPARMFDEYQYFSSNSDEMVEHARLLAERLAKERGLGPTSQVFEIASNDGYLLQHYRRMGVPVLGIEPAGNVAEVAWLDRGIPSLVRYFTAALGAHFKACGWQADLVHGHNVFAHVPDPTDFMTGVRDALKPGGLCVIEAPYLVDFIEKLEFDTIYHEHFSYFSLTAVVDICRRAGMEVVRVERVPIHGGSIRMFFAHAGTASAHGSVAERLEDEARLGVRTAAYYADFARRVWGLRDELVGCLKRLRAEGSSVAAYGASAKGSTLMNVFGIGADLIDFVADRSPAKQGRYTPGNHLPIVAPAALMERKPDYVLLLTWNFEQEILRQQDAYRRAGGKFIIPLPAVRIV